MTDREAIHEHIDSHLNEHVANIQKWVRQKSVSWDNLGMKECAELVADSYRRLGCSEVEILQGRFHPGVWAVYDSGKQKKTIHNYCMYDTRTVKPEGWSHDPWAAELVTLQPYRKVLMGRGALGSKGPYVAWLNALSSIIEVEGELPVNIMFLAEGEEIKGSPSYRKFVEMKREKLRNVKASICPSTAQDATGNVTVGLGLKGMIVIELVSSGSKWGYGPKNAVHSQGAGLVHSPTFRLVQALSTLTDKNGMCKVNGLEKLMAFRKQLTDDEHRLIDDLGKRFKDRDMRDVIPLGGAKNLDQLVGGTTGTSPLINWLYGPTFNVAGLYAGFLGTETGTIPFIVPGEARAMLDMRLVVERSPEEIIDLIRKHLDTNGFADIEIVVYSAFSHNQTSSSHPIVQAALKTVRDWGHTPVVWPIQAGGGPWTVVPNAFNVPCLRGSGLGGGGGGAVNEYMIIEGDGKVAGLADVEKYYVDLLYNVAAVL